MDQEKFGKFIKDIRKKYNLTQKELADKYNVTYQAVSKWENSKNMPDTSLIKQMSKDFNISLEEMFDGEFKEHKNKKKYFVFGLISIIVILIIISFVIIFRPKEENFEFKTLSTSCENFNISGNIAYNKSKSAIYISNIKYCGGDDTDYYKNIECTLYESNHDIERKISSYKYNEEKSIKLEDFLEDVILTVDDYEKTCKEYSKDSLYLSINATNNNNKMITYKIPLTLNDSCSK